MAGKSVLDWFLTSAGKEFSFKVISGASALGILAQILPHTLLAEYYKDTVRLYNNGFSVPVPEKLQERFSKTMDYLGIEETKRFHYKPFMSCGFDIFSIGTFGRFGAHIGLPNNFTFDSVYSIEKYKIKIKLESVVWDTPEGQQLLESLVVPESAQIYAIAREIKMRQSYKIYFDALYGFIATVSTYFAASTVNKKLNYYSKPRSIRVTFYILLSLFMAVNYVFLKDVTQHEYEIKIDKELKATHRIFTEGGIEYYEKLLERNKALRKLLGKEGERKYTVTGNDNNLSFRTKHVPIINRKRFFEL